MSYDSEYTAENSGFSVLSIIGLILSFLIAPAGLIVSIIGVVKKDGRKKGLCIAGIIIGAINTIVQIFLVFIVFTALFGTMAPQMLKYTEKTNVSSDRQFADTLKTAMVTAAMDPGVVNEDSVPYCSDYQDIKDIPYGSFRTAIEEIMGIPIDDMTNQIKSHHSSDAQILYKLDSSANCTIMITTTDSTGQKQDKEEYYITSY